MKKFFGLLSLVMLTAACGGGGSSNSGGYYHSSWEETYEDDCTYGGYGCDYYYDDGSYDNGYYDDGYSDSGYYDDGSGGYYDEYGNYVDPIYSLGKSHEKTTGRNVVGDVAAQVMKTVKSAGKRLAEKYHVTAAVGENIAYLHRNWALIGKSHARTEADVASFTKQLYGIDVNKLKLSLEEAQKGDLELLEENISEVAERWGTTPAMVKEMQKAWFATELKSYGYSK